MEPSTTPPNVASPDAGAILMACVATLAPHFGDSVVLTPTARYATIAAGIRVRFTMAVARDKALTALRELGYVARPDSRPIHEERGEALLVTGWDNQALAARVARLERAVAELLAEHAEIAPKALQAYSDCVETPAYTPAAAELHVALSFWSVPAARPINIATAAGTHHTTFPIDRVDRRTAPEPTRGLLLRIAAAQNTLDKLTAVYAGIARGVIHLYDLYLLQHLGESKRSARQAALRQAASANAACLQLATSELDFRGLGHHPVARASGELKIDPEPLRNLDDKHLALEELLTVMRYRNCTTNTKLDICRHCHTLLRYTGTHVPWRDTWGWTTCDRPGTHEPFPGAYQPDPDPTV
jgi:hypothetical protein